MTTQQAPAPRLGLMLRAARRLRGLTLADLAAELSVSEATVSRMETGHIRIRADQLEQACRVLRLDDAARADLLRASVL